MKFLKSISLFFLYPLIMFLLGALCFFSFESFFYPKKTPLYEQTALEEKQVLTSDTEYVVIETDLLTEESVETVWHVPDVYIGMDREQFIAAMENYEQSPPLSELNRGFVSVEVRSFSRQKVVIRKNYLFEPPQVHFYLSVQDNYVVVMCEDLMTVYMNTSILLTRLPDRLQMEILQNKFMETEKELYDFLETYSS